MSASYGRILG